MEAGQVVIVKTQCVPAGLVPDKLVKLVYQYGEDGRWYCYPVKRKNAFNNYWPVDSSKVTYITPPQDETR